MHTKFLQFWKKKKTSGRSESPENQYVMFPESKLAHKYCKGKGLEIGGSAHMEMDFY